MLRFLTQPLNWKQTRVKRKPKQKKLDHKNKIEKEKVFDEYIFPGILRSLNAKGDLFIYAILRDHTMRSKLKNYILYDEIRF